MYYISRPAGLLIILGTNSTLPITCLGNVKRSSMVLKINEAIEYIINWSKAEFYFLAHATTGYLTTTVLQLIQIFFIFSFIGFPGHIYIYIGLMHARTIF